MGKHMLTFHELEHGYKLSLDNAKQMFEEAEGLAIFEHYVRAYALYQLTIEEIGKCIILMQAILCFLLGDEIDYGRLKTWGFEDHISKSRSSLGAENVMLNFFQNYVGHDCTELFDDLKQSANSLKKANRSKNDSLYVGFNGNKFVSPQECISKKMVDDIAFKALVRIKAMEPMLRSEEEMKKMVKVLKTNV